MLSLSNFAMHFYSLYYLVIIFSFNLLTWYFYVSFSYSTFHILFHLAAVKPMFLFLSCSLFQLTKMHCFITNTKYQILKIKWFLITQKM